VWQNKDPSLLKGPVSQQVWQNKDPSLLKGPVSQQVWQNKDPSLLRDTAGATQKRSLPAKKQ
jgi:hypothetical protein